MFGNLYERDIRAIPVGLLREIPTSCVHGNSPICISVVNCCLQLIHVEGEKC